jgi:hypothetical protein
MLYIILTLKSAAKIHIKSRPPNTDKKFWDYK